MPDIWLDVDAALTEVPVNILPLIDDTDFKTRETAIAYNAAGMDLVWNFINSAGVFTQTAVTPTTAGNYDWVHQGDGMYTIEIPASGGASINNDTEGYGWFTGFVTGVLPWRGPTIGFRAAALNDALCDGGDLLDVNVTQVSGVTEDIATETKQDIIDTNVDAILVDTAEIGTAGAGLTALAQASVCTETRLSELDAATAGKMANQVDIIQTDTTTDIPATIATVDANVDAILVDTGTTLPGTLTTIEGKIDTVDTNVDAVLVDTNELQTDWVNGGRLDLLIDQIITDIAALNNISAADVNAQVLDVLNTDTFAEEGTIPAATTTIVKKINLIYMLARNKVTQTATTTTLFADDGTTSVGTSTVSDDGTTATKGELG